MSWPTTVRGAGTRPRRGNRLGRDARLPPPRSRPRSRRCGGDGHGPARHGPRLACSEGADRAHARRNSAGRAGRASSQASAPTISTRRRRARSTMWSQPTASSSPRCAEGRRAGRAHGEPRAGPHRDEPRRLRGRLRPRAGRSRGAGDPALAGRDVRPGARRLLGRERLPARARDRAGDHPCRRRERGRDQALPAGRRQGNRDAPAPARRRQDVHGRRLQLPGADRGATRRATATRCSASSTSIAPAASAALTALAGGDAAAYRRILEPTVPLSRLVFRAPTQHYKTGVVFLAYLNGFQDHFVMIGGAQAMRPLPYFTALFRLADACRPAARSRTRRQPHAVLPQPVRSRSASSSLMQESRKRRKSLPWPAGGRDAMAPGRDVGPEIGVRHVSRLDGVVLGREVEIGRAGHEDCAGRDGAERPLRNRPGSGRWR